MGDLKCVKLAVVIIVKLLGEAFICSTNTEKSCNLSEPVVKCQPTVEILTTTNIRHMQNGDTLMVSASSSFLLYFN